MARLTPAHFSPSRRALLRHLILAPVAWRVAPFSALVGPSALVRPDASLPAYPEVTLPYTPFRYRPHYPAASPLEDVLRLVPLGSDQFPSERTAAELEEVLAGWSRRLKEGELDALEVSFARELQATPLGSATEVLLRDRNGIACTSHTFAAVRSFHATALLAELRRWLGEGSSVGLAEFQLNALDPVTFISNVRYSLQLTHVDGAREQRVGNWQIMWAAGSAKGWQITALTALPERRAVLRGPGFVDVTHQVLGGNAASQQQMQRGSDYWRTVLDGASGIDVYGNNGVAAGDYNNDGFDDLYVSQPAGLPNRLFRNRGDGTLEDVTEEAGVGVLDNTACALFADFRNCGLQDLLVVTGAGPLLFLNQGNGTFTLKPDAFHFAQPPQGTFTHAAVADYDRDGRLDIYFCLYSYYLGLDQYHYPAPYFDARNGPPNFLMRNTGDATFEDGTGSSGLTAENDRYSFSCAWNEGANGFPDLYVVNDFGRNNLYCNAGDGTFRAVSEAAHVQDVGAGMSAAWGDYANTGRPGIYTANMWSAAGQRVSQLAAFHPGSTATVRELYQRHAQGNALYRDDGTTFTNVSGEAAVSMGRWAWGSDFLDLDHDGHADLYVTNGYITGPSVAASGAPADLGSFFWRQVVGRSPDDSTPSPAYEQGWNALNELIRTDRSWSGSERNVLFLNNGDGTFTEASGPLGLDLLEDGRAFALADLDGDGRLEIIVKNRNGPQVRILRNALAKLGDAVCFRLRGTKSNRDAIGTVVTVRCGELVQTRSLQCGSGFLSQHTRELFFGLGTLPAPVSAHIRWPDGSTQQLLNLPRNQRIHVVEGQAGFTATAFSATAGAWTSAPAAPATSDAAPAVFATWLLDPLPAPAFTLPAQSGRNVSLESLYGGPVLLHFFSAGVDGWEGQLHALDALRAGAVTVLALNVDDSARQAALRPLRLRMTILLATPEIAGVYNIIFRYLFDRRADLPLPTSFLLNARGQIVRVYTGPVTPAALAADLAAIPTSMADRIRLALPFPGKLYNGSFRRNTFTYGVAMFQHGFLDQAAASFAQSIAADPANPEAHYNLGTLNLRRKRMAEARQELQETIKLKPDYPEAWNNLGMIAAEAGDLAEARRGFEQAVTLRPGYATALLNLGNLLRHAGDLAGAEPYLTHALSLTPDDPEANYAAGMLRAQEEQLSAAIDLLKKAISLRPAYPEALNNLGVIYARQGNTVLAEQQFVTCQRLSPNYEATYFNLARLYVAQGDNGRARAAMNVLLKQHPENAAALQALRALGPG